MGQGGQRKPLRFESWKGSTGPSEEIQTHPNPTPWRVQGSSHPCTSSLPLTLGHSDAEGQAPAGVAGRRGKATCPHDVSPQVASATESSLKTPSLCWGLCDSSQAPLGAQFPHLHNGVMWFCLGSAIQLPCPGLVTCYIFTTARPGALSPELGTGLDPRPSRLFPLLRPDLQSSRKAHSLGPGGRPISPCPTSLPSLWRRAGCLGPGHSSWAGGGKTPKEALHVITIQVKTPPCV